VLATNKGGRKEGRKELRTEFFFNTSTLTKTITPEFEPQQTQDSGLLPISQYLPQRTAKRSRHKNASRPRFTETK
jgi:hypothetical protein